MDLWQYDFSFVTYLPPSFVQSSSHAIIHYRMHLRLSGLLHSDWALAKASCRWAGNLYLNWLVYVVKSMLTCLKSSIIDCRVPSFPPNWVLDKFALCLLQQIIVHIRRLGTLCATACEREANFVARFRIILEFPRAFSGRISRVDMICSEVRWEIDWVHGKSTYVECSRPLSLLHPVLGGTHLK